jgi:shikimate dehydrogenase
MKRFAVVGQPIAQSRSPQIHEWFAEQTGAALTYEKIEVTPDGLAERLAALHAQEYAGLNVTSPHKLAALAAAESHAPRAENAGAANTLVRTDTGWHADNTDGEGLIRDLRDNLHLKLAGQRVLLLGAGGAARGVLKHLLDEKPADLVISSRTPWNVEKIAAAFKAHGPVRPSTHVALKGETFDVLVNATAAGHQGQAPRLPRGVARAGAACYDLSYGAAFAPFRDWAKAQGAGLVSDGIGMLVEQAAASFALWHGKRPQTAAVIARLREGGL